MSHSPSKEEFKRALTKAAPLLDEITQRWPAITRREIECLLREQTEIAVRWPNRNVERAWRDLWRAWDRFQAAYLGRASLPEFRRAIAQAKAANTQRARQTLWRDAEDAWRGGKDAKFGWEANAGFGKVGEALLELGSFIGLEQYEDARRAHRPSAFMSDRVAWALRELFKERTGLPQWRLISRLLECAPAIPAFSTAPEKIRQRLDKAMRVERAGGIPFKPSLSFIADALGAKCRDVERASETANGAEGER